MYSFFNIFWLVNTCQQESIPVNASQQESMTVNQSHRKRGYHGEKE